ncbi:MAG: hypothetical protein HC820_05905 [Hydrococcus sp. RM1_1_31]|nr:hypothetical protein [Hydrococcus sp. RM1_1_31]
MEDFKLDIDTINKTMVTEGNSGKVDKMPYRLYNGGANLDIGLIHATKDTSWVCTKRLEYYNLPLLQSDFHWTIDAFKDDE